MKKNKHILVIRLSAMGDVAMTVPVIKALINQYPDCTITFLSKPFLKPLFAELKNVAFFGADVTNRHKGFWGLIRLFKDLKNLKFDAVADLHNVVRSKILTALFSTLHIKTATIDKGRKDKKALTRSSNKIFKQLKTTHERYAEVFGKLGFNVCLENPVFDGKKELSKNTLLLTGDKTEKWIGIAPFAQYASKMYPLELMEKVICDLSNAMHCKILLFGGGEKEINILDELAKKNKNIQSVAGKLSLEEELALISNLDVMLSMDSGNAHFAAMFGIPTITIWGVTHPYTGFAPFNQPFDNAILPDLTKYPKIPCSIYGNKVCEGYEDVMYSIPPKTIVEKIISHFEKI